MIRRITTQAVTATLRAAGFSASKWTRRERVTGYAVRKMGPQVAVFWEDHASEGDGDEKFAAVREALAAAGLREVYTNERGRCVRVVA